MLPIKFQGHRLFGSWEEEFHSFLPYIGMAAIVVMWPRHFEHTFVPPPHKSSLCNLVSVSWAVSQEMSFENVDVYVDADTDTDGGRQATECPLSSPSKVGIPNISYIWYEPAQDKSYNKTWVTSKASDQPEHRPSMASDCVYPSLDSLEAVEGTCDQR